MTRDDVLEFLREREVRPFEWGVHDCVRLAADAWERATGVLPALPTYATETEAKRLLVAAGGLQAAVEAVLGPMRPHRELALCGDGDVILTAFHGEHALGVAWPRYFSVLRQDRGLITLDLIYAVGWWPCQGS